MPNGVYDPGCEFMGNFSQLDGTIEFFGRINALLQPQFRVMDVGAGRGGWSYHDKIPFRRNLRDIRSKVAEFIGVDVDPIVMENQTTTSNAIIVDGKLPAADQSLDFIIADYVLEHVTNVDQFCAEIDRVLKPGGYFCARTPHKYNFVSIAARIIKNANHSRWLQFIQPSRQSIDVFPTAYQCNTLSDIRRIFSGWENKSYIYVSEPQYFLGTKAGFKFMEFVYSLSPKWFTGNLFVFLRKP